jgi:Dolichyl-phosphate-mannose-protein mannosyltransferase
VSWPVLGALVALMALSSAAHLGALYRDLPLADLDEADIVRPAVHIAATGDLNPHWFGHPASTVIYPIAGLFHAWDALAHDGPILTSNPALTARLARSPTEFYVIGRLWTIALSVGALPLLFLVGRRAFNTRIALIATAIWAVLPYPVHLGRIVRSDSAAVFFGLLALWLCLRLLDEPRTRWCVLAGLSVGLAVASRYFMVALVPCLVAAAIKPLLWPRSAAGGSLDSHPLLGERREDDRTVTVDDGTEHEGTRSEDASDSCLTKKLTASVTAPGNGPTTHDAVSGPHVPHRYGLRPALRAAGIAVAGAFGGFVLSTPYFFLDWEAARNSLEVQNAPFSRVSHLTPLGNLRWYLGSAIPESLTWPLVALAAAGVLLVVWRPRTPQVLLVAFCAIFLVGICASKLHSLRWTLEILPVLILLAAFTVDTIARTLAARSTRVLPASILTPVALVAATGVLAIHPVAALLDANANPSTRIAARNWIVSHVPPGSRLLADSRYARDNWGIFYNAHTPARTVPLDHTPFRIDYGFLPRHTLADYQHAGYEYLIVNHWWAAFIASAPATWPDQAALYRDVVCHTQLAAIFTPSRKRVGWPIGIYRLDRPPSRVGWKRANANPVSGYPDSLSLGPC